MIMLRPQSLASMSWPVHCNALKRIADVLNDTFLNLPFLPLPFLSGSKKAYTT